MGKKSHARRDAASAGVERATSSTKSRALVGDDDAATTTTTTTTAVDRKKHMRTNDTAAAESTARDDADVRDTEKEKTKTKAKAKANAKSKRRRANGDDDDDVHMDADADDVHAYDDDGDAAAGSNDERASSSQRRASGKRRGKTVAGVRGGATATTKTPSVKHEIRGIERLLKRDTLTADVRAAKTAQLDVLRGRLAANAAREREAKLRRRYKQVRFVEKRKALRRVDTLKRELDAAAAAATAGAADDDAAERERQRIADELQQWRLRVRYVQEFPLARVGHYISVLRTPDDDANARTRSEILDELAAKYASAGFTRMSAAELEAQKVAELQQDDFFK